MFDIFGSELAWDGRTIADLRTSLPASLLQTVEDEIRGFTSLDTIADERAKAEEESYDNGVEDGKREAKAELKGEIEDAREEGRLEGYGEGREDALADAALAGDVLRVETLLQAMQKAHDVMLTVQNGVQDEKVQYRKLRSLKTGEAKKAASQACSELRIALQKYRSGTV